MAKTPSRIPHQKEPDNGYIKKLIAEGEHQQLDFKFGITDSVKIARSLAAFANTDGGRLLVGVKDNGKIAGVKSEEEFYMIQAASELYTRPQVPFKAKEWQVEGKTVLEIIVPKIPDVLHSAPEKKDKYLIYIRVKDQNIPVNSVWLKANKWKNSGRGIFIKFTEPEKILLNLLETKENITLSHFVKMAGIKSREAENIVAGFVAIGMAAIVFSNTGIVYKLSDDYTEISPEQRLKKIAMFTKK